MTLPYNHFHFVFVGIIISIICIEIPWLYIFLFLYFWFLKRDRDTFKLCLILCLIVFVVGNINLSSVDLNEEVYGTVIQKSETEYSYKLVCRSEFNKIIVYVDKDYYIEVGDYAVFYGEEAQYDNTKDGYYYFYYPDYLKNSYIDGVYFADYFEVLEERFTVGIVNDKIKQYFENCLSGQTLNYVLALITGIDSFDDEQSEVLNDIGVLHLFCISGMHLTFIIGLIDWLLKKINLENNYNEVIKVIASVVFLIITNFQISILRATLMFVFGAIISFKGIDMSKLDLFSISGIIILVFRPNYLFLTSFQLSFLVTFALLITSDLLVDKSLTFTVFCQSSIAYFMSLPILININFEFNLFNIISTSILSIPFSYLIMPLTFYVGIFTTNNFEIVYVLFDSIMKNLSFYDMFIFKIGSFNLLESIIYFFIFYFFLKTLYNKGSLHKISVVLLTFILVISNRVNLNIGATVSFFSVGQGDSSLIRLGNNQGNILIDCFGNVVDLLKSRGITTLDMVIITHGHNDHMGELENVKENFIVKDVVCSKYDALSTSLGCTKYVETGDVIQIADIKLEVVAPSFHYTDENANSVVFKTTINDLTFLFTGDTIEEVELDMLATDISADVLKVPHHGSDTSSCVEFIAAVSPKYAVFSYGVNNTYNLPNYSIINRYSNCINYFTSTDGTVEFKFRYKWTVNLNDD